MRKYLLPEKGNFYRANLHCHTRDSDGGSTPAEIKKTYQALGYDIVAYTDHDIMLDRNYLTDDKFLALNGYEMEINGRGAPEWGTMESCHICLIALEPDNLKQVCWHRSKYLYANAVNYRDKVLFYEDEPDYEREYTGVCISDMMKKGREKGFFVTYNHPTGSLEDYPTYINYYNMNAMEMYNGANEYNPRVYDDMLRAGKRIYCIGGDDNHNGPESTVGCAGSWTMIKADKLEYRSVAQALKAGNFYATQGPEIYELWVEDGIMHIETSDAAKIWFTTAARRDKFVNAAEGEVLNSADYEISRDSTYVRVTVTDERGRTASTNAYFVEDIL